MLSLRCTRQRLVLVLAIRHRSCKVDTLTFQMACLDLASRMHAMPMPCTCILHNRRCNMPQTTPATFRHRYSPRPGRSRPRRALPRPALQCPPLCLCSARRRHNHRRLSRGHPSLRRRPHTLSLQVVRCSKRKRDLTMVARSEDEPRNQQLHPDGRHPMEE